MNKHWAFINDECLFVFSQNLSDIIIYCIVTHMIYIERYVIFCETDLRLFINDVVVNVD